MVILQRINFTVFDRKVEYGKIPSHYTVTLRRFDGYFLQCRVLMSSYII